MIKMIYGLLMMIMVGSVDAETINTVEFGSKEQESRYRTLIGEIRCPVCQGQSIGGSNASLAKDLRMKVAGMLKGGKSNKEIHKFMVDRYGDFVVFKPPVNKYTYLLWLGPFVFLILGGYLIMRERKTHTPEIVGLNLDEAKRLLNEDKKAN